MLKLPEKQDLYIWCFFVFQLLAIILHALAWFGHNQNYKIEKPQFSCQLGCQCFKWNSSSASPCCSSTQLQQGVGKLHLLFSCFFALSSSRKWIYQYFYVLFYIGKAASLRRNYLMFYKKFVCVLLLWKQTWITFANLDNHNSIYFLLSWGLWAAKSMVQNLEI